MNIKVFISPNCTKCVSAKKLAEDLKQQKHKVETFDITTIDGLAEASYYQIQTTPFIVVEKSNNALIPEIDGTIEAADLLGNCFQIVGEA
ncbi:MAG: thioredoxin family protein [Pseudomonadota bacterium]